jgi:hypothetical protein
MNIVRTAILKILVNPEEPGQLRGDLQIIPENSVYAFKDENDLLILLHQVVGSNQLLSSLPEAEADINGR